MTRVLALDIATHTGWAHSDGHSGMQDFSPKRGDSPGMRFLEFRSWLKRMHQLTPFDVIVYEQAGKHRSGAATHICHGMIAEAEAVAALLDIEITSRSPAALKKYYLAGVHIKKRNKERMKQVVENNWPHIRLESDDHADAILLLWMTLHDLRIAGTEWHTRYVA